MKACDCGGARLKDHGHAHWCSSLLPNPGWAFEDFLQRAFSGEDGTHVYVTRDADKLCRAYLVKRGLWHVLTPHEMKETTHTSNNLALAGMEAVEILIEKNCNDDFLEYCANIILSPVGKIKFVEE